MNNKVLVLTTPGEVKEIIDVENNKLEKLQFTSVGDSIYVAVAPCDLTVVYKYKDENLDYKKEIVKVKKGELIFKSSCKGIFKVSNALEGVTELFEKLQKEATLLKEEAEKKEQEYYKKRETGQDKVEKVLDEAAVYED
jgi:hypothetical protein